MENNDFKNNLNYIAEIVFVHITKNIEIQKNY